MRRVIASTFVSLDGVMQAPGAPDEDRTGGFALGGWVFDYWDEATINVIGELFARPFDLLLGRRTYEIFAAHWPYIEDDPIAEKFNAVTKYVATSSDARLTWQNSVNLGNEAVAAVAELKTNDGPDLIIQGSSLLFQSLLAEGLIDEFTLLTFPVILGGGKRLFGAGGQSGAMELQQGVISDRGVQIARFSPHGAVPTGSFSPTRPPKRRWRGGQGGNGRGKMADPIVLGISRFIDATPEAVSDAWLDPGKIGQWLFATPEGRMEKIEIDARVGGRFLIVERRGDENAEHFGEYLEIDRPHRLVFSFAAMREAGFTRVTVTIVAEGQGSRVHLVHEMDPLWAAYEERTREGWTKILEGLARTIVQ